MSGPKHLWSGNWEQESARVAEDQASLPRPAPADQSEPPAAPTPAPARLFTPRQLAIAVAAALATAAVTVVLVTALGGGSAKPRAHRAASTPTVPATTHAPPSSGPPPTIATVTVPTKPAVAGPMADWLGMQIVTTQAGVVINTIRLGSPADSAGLEPGDEITAIDGHPINSVSQIRTDTAGLRLGHLVGIQVLRGSSLVVQTALPLNQRPTIHP